MVVQLEADGRERPFEPACRHLSGNPTYQDLGPMRAVMYSANIPHRDGRMTRLKPNSDNKTLSERESGPSRGGDAPVLTGAEVRGASPVPLNKYRVDAGIAIGSIIVETVWAWI